MMELKQVKYCLCSSHIGGRSHIESLSCFSSARPYLNTESIRKAKDKQRFSIERNELVPYACILSRLVYFIKVAVRLTRENNTLAENFVSSSKKLSRTYHVFIGPLRFTLGRQVSESRLSELKRETTQLEEELEQTRLVRKISWIVISKDRERLSVSVSLSMFHKNPHLSDSVEYGQYNSICSITNNFNIPGCGLPLG